MTSQTSVPHAQTPSVPFAPTSHQQLQFTAQQRRKFSPLQTTTLAQHEE